MGACSAEPAPGVVLPVAVHTLPACDVSSPVKERGKLALQAFGDFEASNESAEVLPIQPAGGALRFPPGTLAIEARIDGPGSSFVGYGERRASGRFDVLLWPTQRECSVFRPDSMQGYPGKGGGQGVGYSREQGLLLAAGGNYALVNDAIYGALTFDVATGAVVSDTSQDKVLREARAFATVTELGDKLLVAGGENPVFGVPVVDLETRDTAELFDPELGQFVGEPIKLSTPRTRHAAVTLPSGDALLIGGRMRTSEGPRELVLVDLISAETRRATQRATLAPRIDPRAVLLSDGRVFVGGGTTIFDDQPACEWLSPDARSVESADCVPARTERAFVAMPGGGVLAVGGCDNDGCQPDEDYDAWWIARDDNAEPVSLPANLVAPRPILLPGSDGSPWLVAALEAAPDVPRLFRFKPWSNGFSLSDVAESVRLPRPDFAQPVSVDPDAFVWLDDDGRHGELLGLRLGTRNRYTQDLALVLLSDPDDPGRPLHLVPDRLLLKPDQTYDGRLWLTSDGPNAGVTVAVADTDYGDVSVALHLAPPDRERDVLETVLPLVLLGDTLLGEAGGCSWPGGSKRGGDFDVPTLVRRGTHVELRFQGKTEHCTVPAGRLSLALRAAQGVSIITQLDVKRGVP